MGLRVDHENTSHPRPGLPSSPEHPGPRHEKTVTETVTQTTGAPTAHTFESGTTWGGSPVGPPSGGPTSPSSTGPDSSAPALRCHRDPGAGLIASGPGDWGMGAGADSSLRLKPSSSLASSLSSSLFSAPQASLSSSQPSSWVGPLQAQAPYNASLRTPALPGQLYRDHPYLRAGPPSRDCRPRYRRWPSGKLTERSLDRGAIQTPFCKRRSINSSPPDGTS